METPYISVIISAYNRKDFIKSSVESALRQDLNRSKYEILVIKNFYSEIDDFLKANGVKTIFYSAPRKKFTIAPAVKASRGRILAFLDDDDEWEKSKLSRVYKLFTEDSKLGYYHNNYITIDDTGKEIDSGIRKAQRESIEKDGSLYVSDEEKEMYLYKIMDNGYFFNNSCVSIRKDLISKYIAISAWGVDVLLAYSGIVSKYSVLYDSKKLTKYRISRWNSSMSHGNRKRLIDLTRIAASSEKKVRRMVIEAHRPELTKALDYSICWKALVLDILELKNKNIIISDLIKFVKCNNEIYGLFAHKGLVALSVFYLIYPKKACNILIKKMNT